MSPLYGPRMPRAWTRPVPFAAYARERARRPPQELEQLRAWLRTSIADRELARVTADPRYGRHFGPEIRAELLIEHQRVCSGAIRGVGHIEAVALSCWNKVLSRLRTKWVPSATQTVVVIGLDLQPPGMCIVPGLQPGLGRPPYADPHPLLHGVQDPGRSVPLGPLHLSGYILVADSRTGLLSWVHRGRIEPKSGRGRWGFGSSQWRWGHELATGAAREQAGGHDD
jgi:hypothetical protein